jgi:ribonuclease HI
MTWHIYTDGAARGNPGPAAYAFVIKREGGPPVVEKGRLGSTTNNVAEYTALVKALERAAQLGADRLVVHSDSELMVEQMNGRYRVKNPDLLALHNQAKKLAAQFEQVVIRHIPRSENSEADRLCNEALDNDESGGRKSAKGAQRSAPRRRSPQAAAVREEALECLRSAITFWANGSPNVPKPEDVWDQLWSILEEHGVLRTSRTGS